MKKYLFMSISCGLAVTALLYFYRHSASGLTENHHRALTVFSDAKSRDVSTVQEILRSRGFISANFDQLVLDEKELESVCADLRNPANGLYKKLSGDLDESIDKYCRAVEEKLSDIETFKSKNAIFKNSLYYLHKLTTDEKSFHNLVGRPSKQTSLMRDLLRGSVTYAAVSTPESRALLQGFVDIANRVPESEASSDLFMIRSHARNILTAKLQLDDLTVRILSPRSLKTLDEAREIYLKDFAEQEQLAGLFRESLLGLCLVLLGLVIFCVFRVSRLAQALVQANLFLEDRVRERTAELQESKNMIIQQQQTLIATAKMSALGEMAGGVAHEINNPLSIISMKAEQLSECLEEGDLDQEIFKDALGAITRTTQRIAKIVAGLRFFARDGQREAFQFSPLKNLIEETLSFCREKFSNHGIDIEMPETLASSLTIECRAVEISQVLLNLFNNSFDAVQECERKWMRVAVEDHPHFVKIAVTDSGSGIPLDIQGKIMQPFFTTKEIGKGTGLGLSISRGIVESHKGKIYVDNDCPNTCLVILLPKVQDEASAPDLSAAARVAA